MPIKHLAVLAVVAALLVPGLVSLRPPDEGAGLTAVRVQYIPHPSHFVAITDTDSQPFVVPVGNVLVLTGGEQFSSCPLTSLYLLRNGRLETRVDNNPDFHGPIVFRAGEAVSLRGNNACGRRVFGYLAEAAPAPAPFTYFPHPESFVTIRQEDGAFTVPSGKTLLLMSAFAGSLGPYGPVPNLEVRVNGAPLTGSAFPPGYTDPEVLDPDKMRSIARAGDVVQVLHPSGLGRVCGALLD